MTRPKGPNSGELEAVLTRFANLRVGVVGDVLLDEYREGDVERVSPEAPVPVVSVSGVSQAPGGAANVARNVASLGGQAELVGVIGRDLEGSALRELMEETGLDSSGLVVSETRPTSHKLRVVARGQQMIRLDREQVRPLDSAERAALRRQVEERMAGFDVIILEDYDKGVLAEGTARWIIERARADGRLVVADPKHDIGRFRGANLVKPNLAEALHFVSGSSDDFSARRSLLEKMRDAIGGGEIVMTRGRLGMSALDQSGTAFDVPTQPLEVYDVQGAGDTSVAALALCRAAGASLLEACIVANAAASVAVSKVGTAAVDVDELRDRLPEIVAGGSETGTLQ